MSGAAEAFALPAAAVARFDRDGFCGPVPILDAVGVDRLRDALERLLPRLKEFEDRLYEVEVAWSERPDEVVCHFLGGWRVEPELARLMRDPAITVPCAQVLGVRRLRFWHDQVFHKPPRHPGVVPWHQDYSYWQRTAPARHVTLNLMLDDADEDNGCLCFVPGSHRWGLLPPQPFDADLDAIQGALTAEQRAAFRPVPVPLRAGEATLHHSHVLHGSGPNRSDRPRRALVFNYMAADTRVADGSAPLLRGVPPLPAGAIVDGEHFPIVLDLDAGTAPRGDAAEVLR